MDIYTFSVIKPPKKLYRMAMEGLSAYCKQLKPTWKHKIENEN